MKIKTLACALSLAAVSFGACKKEEKKNETTTPTEAKGDTKDTGATGDTAAKPTETKPADPGAGAATPGAPAAAGSMEMLSNGAEPRFELKYQPAAGTKQVMEMAMDMSMDMAPMGSIVMPTMIMTADAEVTKADASSMTVQMTFTDVDARDTKDSMAGMADMLKGELAKVKGTKTTMTIDPHGKVLSSDISSPSNDPMLAQTMQQTKQSLDQMLAQLPKEPVGKGAKWKITQQLESGGMKMDQSTVFELVDVSATTATIKAVSTMSAPKQTIDQGGMSATLEKLDGNSAMEMKIDFTKIVPSVEGNISMKMSMSAMGQKMDMTMGTKMKIGSK